VAAGQNDPGLYARTDELLRPHCTTHRRAVVMLDADWEGSPGAARIHEDVSERVARVWEPVDVAVVVLDPEIEAWFWQPDSPHVAAAMNYQGKRPYREILTDAGHWPPGSRKPLRPKEALQFMRRTHRTDLSPAVLQRAASHASVRDCVDPAFRTLCDALRGWFPLEQR